MNNIFIIIGKRFYFLRETLMGRKLLKLLAYPIVLWFFILSKLMGGSFFAIKGSFTRKDWVFGLSDIDLVVIFSDDLSLERCIKLTRVFNWWQRIFPFVSDVDYFKYKDFLNWQVFGGVKALQTGQWKWLGAKPEIKKYLYHPLKFRLNVLHELGFLHEWFEVNYCHEIQNEYRVQALQRVLKKILLNIDWLVELKDFFPNVQNVDAKYSQIISRINDVQNKEEALVCYQLITKLFSFEITSNFDDLPLELKREVSASHTRESKIDFKNDFFRCYWFLLKCSGHFNPDILIKFAQYATDPFAQILALAIVECRLNEGYGIAERIGDPYLNHLRGDLELHPLYGNISQLACRVHFLGDRPIPPKVNVALITSTWGLDQSHIDTLHQSHEMWKKQTDSFIHIHIVMNNNKNHLQFLPDLFVYHVESDDLNSGLWHKEALQNIGGHLGRFQKYFIFLDSDVYSKDTSYINRMKEKLKADNAELVQGFSKVEDTLDIDYCQSSWVSQHKKGIEYWRAPGLIWGMTYKTFGFIQGFNSLIPEGSNDGAFISEILDIKFGEASSRKWFSESVRKMPKIFKLDYLEVEVVHINHGQSRDYINRSYFFDLLAIPMKDIFQQDFLGILNWRKENVDMHKLLLFCRKIESYSFEEFYARFKNLLGNNIIKTTPPFIHMSWDQEGSFLECLYTNHGFISGSIKNKFEISIPKQACSNVDFIFNSIPFCVKKGEMLKGVIKLTLPNVELIKIEFMDASYGQVFADLRFINGQPILIQLNNIFDRDLIINLKIFLSAPSGTTFQLDLSDLQCEIAPPRSLIQSAVTSTHIPLEKFFIDYFSPTEIGVCHKLGNGFHIEVKEQSHLFQHHIIRLELTLLESKSGYLSFLLECSQNTELKLFIEDKEGYCFQLTDCKYQKYATGEHQVDYEFSWLEETSFPNLFIMFRCEGPGDVKIHQLELKI